MSCIMPSLRNQPARAVKRQRWELTVTPQFPPEIWEHIFRNIPKRELLSLRLVCRSWSDIISGSILLMDCYFVTMAGTKRNQLLGHTVPATCPPVIVRLVMRRFRIESCVLWWPDHAQNLKELRLMFCTVPVAVLFEMLRHTKNLRTLILFSVDLTGPGEPDFRLDRLKSLELHYVCYGDEEDEKSRNILGGFDRLAPRVENLVLNMDVNPISTKVLESIRTVQSTLTHLNIFRCSNVLAELCKMKDLRLTGISLELEVRKEPEQWIRFCKMQPLLETLTMSTANSNVLLETGRLLPKLKALTLNVHNNIYAFSLNTMPGLQYLKISGLGHMVRFYNATSPNLEEIVLKFVETINFFQFIQRCPKLKQMRLDDCRLKEDPDIISTNFTNLTVLVLKDLRCNPSVCLPIINNSLNLEELQLISNRFLDDQTFRKICVKLKYLKRLTLRVGHYLSAMSANYIIRNCHALEELDANGFSEAILDRIEAVGRIRVKRPQPQPRLDDMDDETTEEAPEPGDE